MRVPLFLAVLFFSLCSQAQNTQDLVAELDREIAQQKVYDSRKEKKIDSLKTRIDPSNPLQRYLTYSAIYTEYRKFKFDSAFVYAGNMQRLASDLGDHALMADAKIKTGFVLVSAGMFNEALDTLRSVNVKALPDSIKTAYYHLMARSCYDLADFNRNDVFRTLYTSRATRYIDSALAILPERSLDYLMLDGLKQLHTRNMKKAREIYEDLLKNIRIDDEQLAITASTLSFIYFNDHDPDKATSMLMQAAMADIRSSTKETVAMQNLANLFYTAGETDLAYKYIRAAKADADFYGARQRLAQVAAIYPVIEGKQLTLSESRRKSLLIYAALITAFTISSIVFLVIIYRQNKKLKAARIALSQVNESLSTTNRHLQDANKIKEQYIWYYFSTTAEYINRLDALKKSLDMMLITKKLDKLKQAIDSIDIKNERESLYHNFDIVFLKLFPDFVSRINSILPEAEKVQLKEGQLLNTELRIYALIRMGIHDHDRIAKILDYSVTTIYTYKTRFRNKAGVPHEAFDQFIMEIPAI